MHALVDLFAPLGDLRLADPRQPHRLHQIVDPAGRHATDPGLLDHRDQRFLRALARFEKRREVAASPQLGDTQLQRPETGVEAAVAVAVAPGDALAAALVAPRPDLPLDVALHRQLQHCLRDGSNRPRRPSPTARSAPISLRSSGPLACFRSKFGNSTLAGLTRWPSQRHHSPTPRINPKIPPQAWTLSLDKRQRKPCVCVGYRLSVSCRLGLSDVAVVFLLAAFVAVSFCTAGVAFGLPAVFAAGLLRGAGAVFLTVLT